MFSDASLDPKSLPSTSRQRCAVYKNPCCILIKPTVFSSYRLAVRRSQPFVESELSVFRVFLTVLRTLIPSKGTPVFDDLLAVFMRRVVARAVSEQHQRILLKVLDQFNQWSATLYEGKQIAS